MRGRSARSALLVALVSALSRSRRAAVKNFGSGLDVYRTLSELGPKRLMKQQHQLGTFGLCHKYSWAPPTLCRQGNAHWRAEDLRAALPEFAALYSRRPVPRNQFGSGVNHAFALWFTTRKLKPQYIVESGVFTGQGTWLLRNAAGPDAQIFCLDPVNNLVYRELPTGKTRYFIGEGFIDLADMDWDSLIPQTARNSTLVVLDDHISVTERLPHLLAAGFRHLWMDDNPNHRGAEEYTFNQICAPVPPGFSGVPYAGSVWNSSTWRMISLEEHASNLGFVLAHTRVYFEFPPIFDGCNWDPQPLLASEDDLLELGLPLVLEETHRYTHTHPPYVMLQP